MTEHLTASELDRLIQVVVEEADRMDDDGRDGAFEASPLRPIYEKLKRMHHAAFASNSSTRTAQ
jgi:hypothetical protein